LTPPLRRAVQVHPSQCSQVADLKPMQRLLPRLQAIALYSSCQGAECHKERHPSAHSQAPEHRLPAHDLLLVQSARFSIHATAVATSRCNPEPHKIGPQKHQTRTMECCSTMLAPSPVQCWRLGLRIATGIVALAHQDDQDRPHDWQSPSNNSQLCWIPHYCLPSLDQEIFPSRKKHLFVHHT